MRYLLIIVALFFVLQSNAQNKDFKFAKVLIVKKKQEGINYIMKLAYYNQDKNLIRQGKVYVSRQMYFRLEKDHFYTPGEFYNKDACKDCACCESHKVKIR